MNWFAGIYLLNNRENNEYLFCGIICMDKEANKVQKSHCGFLWIIGAEST